MAKLELVIERASITVRNLKAGSYPFKGMKIGKWDIPQDEGDNVILPFLELTCKKMPVRISARSMGFLMIGKKNLSQLVGEDRTIKPDSGLAGTLVITTKDGRNNLAIEGITAMELLG